MGLMDGSHSQVIFHGQSPQVNVETRKGCGPVVEVNFKK
jgi:hypothetical protein